MTKIDRENVMQTWEAIHDAALTRHEDGGAELARLVIYADDVFEALAAERDALKAERDKAVAMKDALVGDKIMLRSELAAAEAERDRLAGLVEDAKGALQRIELSTDSREQGSIAMATLAKLEKEKTGD